MAKIVIAVRLQRYDYMLVLFFPKSTILDNMLPEWLSLALYPLPRKPIYSLATIVHVAICADGR